MAPSQNLMYVAPSPRSKLEPQKETTPEPKTTNDVVIRLKAIAINPADIKMVDQGHRVTDWPIVPGLDGAGIVEAIGDDVRRFAIGDEVLAQFTPGPVSNGGGSYQTVAVVNESMVAHKPERLSWEAAASIPVCYFTAMVGLGTGLSLELPFLPDGPTSGKLDLQSILVLGGSSALGASAIQLLRLAVPKAKILTTASRKHHELLTRMLGAHRAIDRSSSSLIVDIRNATPDSKGVDAILDVVGAGSSGGQIFDALRREGPRRYAQVWTGDVEIEVPGDVDSVLFRSRDYLAIPGGKNMFLALEVLLEDGKYAAPLPIRQVGNGLESLEAGLDLMRQGVSGEKLVVLV